MKLTRKILALMLCLTMILGMAITVSADSTHKHTITITHAHEGFEYTAYQIFSGDLSKEGVLSNVEWGNGVDGTALLAALQGIADYATCKDAEDVASVLAKDSSRDNQVAKDFADIAAGYVTTAAGVSTYANGKYTIDVTGDGYYLVVNTKVPAGETNVVVSRYILEVVANVEVGHKGTFPTVDKKIVENGERVALNEASIGDEVVYEIVGTLPYNIDDYNTYYYVFSDTLSKGLTFKTGSMTVTVNGIDVTDYFYRYVSTYSETDGTDIAVGMTDILALENLTEPVVGAITKDTKVVLTYTAILNENAIIGNDNNNSGNPNIVDLEYSNDPNQDGDGTTTPPPPAPEGEIPEPTIPTGVTPKKEVKTYTTALEIKKTDGAGNILTGAEFTLTGDGVNVVVVTGDNFVLVESGTGTHYKLNNGTYTTTDWVEDNAETKDVNESTVHLYATLTKDYVLEAVYTIEYVADSVDVKAFVDANGIVKFTGLGAGTYTLTESVTPAGFNTMDPITFDINFDTETQKFSSNLDTVFGVTADGILTGTIKNYAGSTLPSTGGMGTTLFYAFGSVLFLGAAVLLVTKKRMSA